MEWPERNNFKYTYVLFERQARLRYVLAVNLQKLTIGNDRGFAVNGDYVRCFKKLADDDVTIVAGSANKLID